MKSEADIEKLFETLTVEEVVTELKKIRNTIERKKEDLRVMVGERYRDLIEAADTIQSMESSAAGVCTEVAAVQRLCSSLQHRGLIGFKTTPAANALESDSNSVLSVAAQVKVVVMASSRVWCLLETGQLLPATLVYLLAQHTHTALMLSQATHKVDIRKQFPVLARQWASVQLLPDTIKRLCHHTITTSSSSSTQAVCQAVVSLQLLQGDSLSATLQTVLQLLQDVLLRSLVSYTPQQTARVLVTCFAEQLIRALTVLHAVFHADDDRASAVEQLLESVTGSVGEAPIFYLQESHALTQRLSYAVRSYRPQVRPGGSALQAGELRSSVASWLRAVTDAASLHLDSILGYCPSVQSVCAVQTGVLQMLSQVPQTSWAQVTQSLELGEWCVWEEVVRRCVMKRARELVRLQLAAATQQSLADISQLVSAIRTIDKVRAAEGEGVVSYVWSEAAGDLPDKVGWLSASQRTLQQGGGLAYKSLGYTPRTQTLCSALNSSLEQLRLDLQHMQHAGGEGHKESVEDYKALLELLQQQSGEAFLSLVRGIEDNARPGEDAQQHRSADDDRQPWLSEDEGGSAARLTPEQAVCVALARVCHALTNICPNLQLCAIATALINPDTVRRVGLGLSVECSDESVWESTRAALVTANTTLLQRFLATLTDQLADTINNQLTAPLKRDSVSAALANMALCESVEVSEEGSEEKLLSKLRVPCQPSPALVSGLHALCVRLNAASLHTLNRSFSRSVAGSVCRCVVGAYEPAVAAVTAANNQQLALHLIFDLKFVAASLLPSDPDFESVGNNLQQLQLQLEGCVDPFDMSVFESHLSARVRAAANRSQVILGPVMVRDRHHPTVNLTTTAAPVLPVVPVVDIARFSNVPLPKTVTVSDSNSSLLMESTSSAASHVAQSSKKLESPARAPPTAPLTVASSSSVSRSSASSIFSAMSSSWFGSSSYK